MPNDLPLNKEAILDAAEQTLRRYGPEKTSVVDVARALQVSHGTLYRHFPSKAALREAVTERWLSQISDPLESIAEQAEGHAIDCLKLWVDTLVRSKRTYAADDPEMFTMYAMVTVEAVGIIGEHVDKLLGQLTRILKKGIEAKEIRDGQPEAMAKAIFISTFRFHHPAHAPEWSSQTIDEDFEAVWDLLVSGLSPR